MLLPNSGIRVYVEIFSMKNSSMPGLSMSCWFLGFLPGIYFRGDKIYYHANFFCYANFLLFCTKILGDGQKSVKGKMV